MSIETVQQLLEKMVPELHEYKVRRIFSADEIRTIVRKRTNFEYALMRRTPVLTDYLRYIQFEMNLDALRRARKLRMKQDLRRANNSDFAIVQHIHFLFTRATRKFTNDINLWFQYIDWAAALGATKRVDRIFPLALQHHPLVPALWLKAALYQYEAVGNVDLARMYFQRGLRVNPASTLLWHEFFRMEVRYVGRLAQRKAVLGLVPTAPELAARARALAHAASAVDDVADADADKDAASAAARKLARMLPLGPADRAVLSGIVPLTIFKNAVRTPALAADPSFALGFLPLVSQWVDAHEATVPLQAMESARRKAHSKGGRAEGPVTGGYAGASRSAAAAHRLVPLTTACLRFVGADYDSLYGHIAAAALAAAPYDEAVWDARARAALLAAASTADAADAANAADAVGTVDGLDFDPSPNNADIGTHLLAAAAQQHSKSSRRSGSVSSKPSKRARSAPVIGYLTRYPGDALLCRRFSGPDAVAVGRYEQALHARPTPRMHALVAAFLAGRLRDYSVAAAAHAADAARAGAPALEAAASAAAAAATQQLVLVWRGALLELCRRAALVGAARAPLLLVWLATVLQSGATVDAPAAVDAALEALVQRHAAALGASGSIGSSSSSTDTVSDVDWTIEDPADLSQVLVLAARTGALAPSAAVLASASASAGAAGAATVAAGAAGPLPASAAHLSVGAQPAAAAASSASAVAAASAAAAEEAAALRVLWSVVAQIGFDAHTRAVAAGAGPAAAWTRARQWAMAGLRVCSDMAAAQGIWRLLVDAHARQAASLALVAPAAPATAAAAAAAAAEAPVTGALAQLSAVAAVGDDLARAVRFFSAAAEEADGACARAVASAAVKSASAGSAAAAAADAAAAARAQAASARAGLHVFKGAYLEWALSASSLPLLTGPAAPGASAAAAAAARKVLTRLHGMVTGAVDTVLASLVSSADDYMLALDVEVRAGELAHAAADAAETAALSVAGAPSRRAAAADAAKARLRTVFEAAVSRYGTTSVALWCKYARCLLFARRQAGDSAAPAETESHLGSAELDELNMVRWRAHKTLAQQLRPQFALDYDRLVRPSS
jgi:hypothetical protein